MKKFSTQLNVYFGVCTKMNPVLILMDSHLQIKSQILSPENTEHALAQSLGHEERTIGFVLLIININFTLWKNLKVVFEYAVLWLIFYYRKWHWEWKRTEILAYQWKDRSIECVNAGSVINFFTNISC